MSDNEVRTDKKDGGGLTRRQALLGLGAAGLVAGGSVTMTACAADTSEGGGPEPDPSRRELGGQPIYDAEPLDGATILPPLRDRVLALKSLLVTAGVLTEDGVNLYVDAYRTRWDLSSARRWWHTRGRTRRSSRRSPSHHRASRSLPQG